MKQLPPVDYDKIATYRWKVWTAEGSWWGQVERVPIEGPFKTEAEAHEWVLSFEERKNEGRNDVEDI